MTKAVRLTAGLVLRNLVRTVPEARRLVALTSMHIQGDAWVPRHYRLLIFGAPRHYRLLIFGAPRHCQVQLHVPLASLLYLLRLNTFFGHLGKSNVLKC